MLASPLPPIPGVASKMRLREQQEMEKEKKMKIAKEKDKQRVYTCINLWPSLRQSGADPSSMNSELCLTATISYGLELPKDCCGVVRMVM